MKTSSSIVGLGICACVGALSACDAQLASGVLPGQAAVGTPSAGSSSSFEFKNGTLQTGRSAAPVVGGTLLSTRDGNTIVAADADRDAVFLVDAHSHAVTEVALQPGDEPGRVAEGPNGTVFVALRRGGAVVALDLASGTVSERASVCGSPRGLAYDAASAAVYVACRSGELITLRASDLSVTRTLTLDPDLRDVIVRGQGLVVTRFLNAEVLVIGADGSVSRRATPDPAPGCATATVMSRALLLSSGQVVVAHQTSSDGIVGTQPGGYGSSPPSGSSCGGGLVNRVVSTVDVDTPDPSAVGVSSAMTFRSAFVPSAGPLDIAVDEQTAEVAMIATDGSLNAKPGFGGATGPAAQTTLGGQALPPPVGQIFSSTPGASLWLAPLSSLSNGSQAPASSFALNGQAVAVAFNNGSYVVQSREPAQLELQDGSIIKLSDDSHADTGHMLFHVDSGVGISCSSCHPEGGEDGHTWHFAAGMRRTLPLQGGILSRAPFHWDGSLPDMNALFTEVMVNRMDLQASVDDEQIAALGSFLNQIPEPAATDGLDPDAVTRGHALFNRNDVGCATCHMGAEYTNNQLADVGTGGEFVTPSLLGVGLRSPIFHDGCAKSVAERFGPCGGDAHGTPSVLSASEQADLITFLRSL